MQGAAGEAGAPDPPGERPARTAAAGGPPGGQGAAGAGGEPAGGRRGEPAGEPRRDALPGPGPGASVVALHLSRASRAPLQRVERAEALREQGLAGDRHAWPNGRRSVLLVDQEVLDELGLAPGEVREQVTVRGLDLQRLVFGSRLLIGEALLEVTGPCAPCERMNELRPGLRARLEGRRGRFARVIEPGVLAVGDRITVLPPAPAPAA